MPVTLRFSSVPVTVAVAVLALVVWCDSLVGLVQCDNDDVMSHSEVRSVRIFESAEAAAAHAHRLQSAAASRFHKLAESDDSSSIASSLVVLVPALTVGPYFEALTDYVDTSDLLAAAKAGASGVTTDRVSVLNGAPLALTFNVYNVSGSLAYPLQGATVYIWHCDAYGVYSAVPLGTGNLENTVGQKWLRGYQATSASGTVTFNTIIPGWYTGRTCHFHIRVHLANAASNETFVITTQLFPSTAVVTAVSSLSPYTSDTQTYTSLTSDSIYSAVSSALAAQLILNTTGTASAYAATFNLGIDSSASSASASTTTVPAGTTPSGPPPSGTTVTSTTTAASVTTTTVSGSTSTAAAGTTAAATTAAAATTTTIATTASTGTTASATASNSTRPSTTSSGSSLKLGATLSMLLPALATAFFALLPSKFM